MGADKLFQRKIGQFYGDSVHGDTVEDDEAVLFGEYAAPGTPPPFLRKDLILKSLRLGTAQ